MKLSSLRDSWMEGDTETITELLSSLLNKGAALGLVFSAVFVLWVGYCLTRPYTVMWINSLTIVSPDFDKDTKLPIVEAGDYLEYVMDYCKNKEYQFTQAEVQNSFRDGVIYNVPIESGPLPAGCAKALFVLHVPAIPEGRYHLEMLRTYSVNPLRKIEVRGVSGDFKLSTQRRTERMLRLQLPKVIPKIIQQIPELR